MRARLMAVLIVGTIVAGVLGCRDRGRSTASAPATEPTEGDAAANQPLLLGVDSEDDPHAPACLPLTEKGGHWIKREPIRVMPPAQLAEVFGPAEAARYAYFRLKSVTRCAYALKRGAGRPVMAKLILIETLSAADAYGLLTCRSGATETYRIGGETRVERTGGLTLHCWQGNSYVCVSTMEDDSETTEQIIRLLMHICSRIEHEDLPAPVPAFPTENRLPGKLWLVRHVASLPPSVFESGFELDVKRVAEVLGLGKDTLICVAAYDVPQARRPDMVWAVRYPTIKAAHDAYARYARLINAGVDPIARSASVHPAQGSYLVGTWTAEEESLLYVLPQIVEQLPPS